MLEIAYGLVGIVIGLVVGVFILKNITTKQSKLIIDTAEKEGEQIKKNKIFQAREKFVQLKSEHEDSINKRSQKNGSDGK